MQTPDAARRRLRVCVEAWPECNAGEYDPRCCRFPKSCSCTVYDDERVAEADLEPRPDPPAATVDPPFVEETLAWCNEMRAANGEPPLSRLPVGEKDDPESCPCGRATGLYVDRESFGSSKDAWKSSPRQLPIAVCVFVTAFDAGELPQYDNDPVEEGWNED